MLTTQMSTKSCTVLKIIVSKNVKKRKDSSKIWQSGLSINIFSEVHQMFFLNIGHQKCQNFWNTYHWGAPKFLNIYHCAKQSKTYPICCQFNVLFSKHMCLLRHCTLRETSIVASLVYCCYWSVVGSDILLACRNVCEWKLTQGHLWIL